MAEIISEPEFHQNDLVNHFGGVDLENKCTICEESFTSNMKLKMHVNFRHKKGLKITKCNICTRPFQNVSQLNLHKNDCHAGGERRYKCDDPARGWSVH